MGMSAGGGGGSVKAEPNVTPLVDVMLVLLIIFMVIIPTLTSGLNATPPQGINLNTGATNGIAFDTANVQELTFTLSGALGESETGGATITIVPRTGGNRFAGSYFTSYTNDNFFDRNRGTRLSNTPATQDLVKDYDVNGAFLVRWDRESNVVRTATQATLEIQDGSEKTPITLTRADLRVGGFGYMRRSSQVSVHMKVEGATPADEYSNFVGKGDPTGDSSPLGKALAEKEHLKAELLNEKTQTEQLRREVASLRQQLAEERAKNGAAPLKPE